MWQKIQQTKYLQRTYAQSSQSKHWRPWLEPKLEMNILMIKFEAQLQATKSGNIKARNDQVSLYYW